MEDINQNTLEKNNTESSTDNNIPCPKKRGRKPKEKSTVVKVPQKRGRKPKEKKDEKPKEPSKRGRKKKNIIPQYNINPQIKMGSDTLTYLPSKENTTEKNISFGDLNITMYTNKNTGDDLILEDDIPSNDNNNDNDNVNDNINDNDNDNITTDTQPSPYISSCQINNSSDESFDLSDDSPSDSCLETSYNKNDIVVQQNYLPKDIIQSTIHRYKQINILKAYQNATTTGEWIKKTDVNCWWCCHKFNNPPLALPYKYDNLTETFYVTGIFCSFPCMKAYNIYDTKCSINTLRGTYISKMYMKMGGKFPLIAAPPRCCLKMFGGSMTINEFRDTKKQSTYILYESTLVYNTPHVEEYKKEKVSLKTNNIRLSRPRKNKT